MTGFAVRGVIEGFYGRPWSPSQRLEMVEFIAARGMTTFVYGPKDDPALRRDWRVPFNDIERARLVELRRHCEAAGVELLVCVSPGLTIRYSDADDVAALADKLASTLDIGAAGVGLLLDDIPDRLQHPADRAAFGSLAEAHALLTLAVADRVRARHAGASMFVCPTIYWGYGDEPYLVDLAARLPADIDLCWTGRAICSATLDLHDAEVFTAATGRPPLYWDNYPVNDVAMTYEAHLGPYQGRDPRLATASRGIVANPMEHFESSKIPLATVADFLADPDGYDPEESWHRAIADVVGGSRHDAEAGADVEAFATYATNVRLSCLEPSDSPEIVRLIEDLTFAATAGTDEERIDAATALARAGQRLRDAVVRIGSAGFANPGLAAEQTPWLRVAGLGADAIVALGGVFAAPDAPSDAAVAAALGSHLDALRQQRFRVFGDVLEMTLTDLVDPPANHPRTDDGATP
ncbi:MAG: beta-N-acetylglucosaminidase domain-containing protein [Nocardioidaceae bacterium]|nr:beta-N-acetylglucosaminidase domain-containing protein [Nocardioidaceae bacterium]